MNNSTAAIFLAGENCHFVAGGYSRQASTSEGLKALASACSKKQNSRIEEIVKLMVDSCPLRGTTNQVLMPKINSNILKKSELLQEVCHA